MRESDGNGWRSHNVGERAPLLAGETINTINTCTDTSSSTSSTTAAAASDFQTTPWRWYMLIGLSLLGALQSGIWNTFGPINDAVKPVYGWEHDWMVALIANWVGVVLNLPIPSPSLSIPPTPTPHPDPVLRPALPSPLPSLTGEATSRVHHGRQPLNITAPLCMIPPHRGPSAI